MASPDPQGDALRRELHAAADQVTPRPGRPTCIIQRKRKIVALLDWVAGWLSATDWVVALFIAGTAGLVGVMLILAAPANLGRFITVGGLALSLAFCAYMAGRMRSDVKEQRQAERIRHLKQALAHDTRRSSAATQAMSPVTVNADGQPTELLPWIREEES